MKNKMKKITMAIITASFLASSAASALPTLDHSMGSVRIAKQENLAAFILFLLTNKPKKKKNINAKGGG